MITPARVASATLTTLLMVTMVTFGYVGIFAQSDAFSKAAWFTALLAIVSGAFTVLLWED